MDPLIARGVAGPRLIVRRLGASLAVAGATACHHAPGPASLPEPSGTPPAVQAPTSAAPLPDPASRTSAAVYDPALRRFDVVAVADTTFTILIGNDHWVRRGVQGVAVDPRRRDALVARFRVLSRSGDSVTALVTGQTTRVSAADVALIQQPAPGLLRQTVFWLGLFAGAGLGVTGALLTR